MGASQGCQDRSVPSWVISGGGRRILGGSIRPLLVVGAVLDGYQHYLKLRATGTHSEVLLKFLSGSPSREVQVHLCGDPRGAWVWKDGLLHASKIREVKGAREAWMDNLGVIAPEVMGEDENAELRREAEAARLDLKLLEEEKRQGLVAEAEKKTRRRLAGERKTRFSSISEYGSRKK